MFLIWVYALKFKVKNDARVMPSSDHHVYILLRVYYKFVVVWTLMWLVKAEPLT